MQNSPIDQHLSQITTLWSLVRAAHEDETVSKDAAKQALLERYGGAVKRYLYKALGDAEAVSELYQDWALEFVRGAFRGADPARGRFRNYLKSVVYYLIADYRAEQKKRRQMAVLAEDPMAYTPSIADTEREFADSWRTHLLERTWSMLAEMEQNTGQPVHTVLQLRVEKPNLKSPAMAEELSALLGKTVSADAGRQMLHRAREKFADLLIDEVANSMDQPTVEELSEELQDLELLAYCKPRLEKRESPG